MITPSDLEYLNTKEVKNGSRKLEYPFSALCAWINDKYRINPINSFLDYIDNGATPRLNVVLESIEDELKFHDANFNFDAGKQKVIAVKFKELQSAAGREAPGNLFVCFHAFMPVAAAEANEKIADEEIKAIENLSEDIWTIRKDFRTVFYYTDSQIAENEANGLSRKIEKAYYRCLVKHDEFGYFNADRFGLSFDSKESFEREYNGNWFYYYKDH